MREQDIGRKQTVSACVSTEIHEKIQAIVMDDPNESVSSVVSSLIEDGFKYRETEPGNLLSKKCQKEIVSAVVKQLDSDYRKRGGASLLARIAGFDLNERHQGFTSPLVLVALLVICLGLVLALHFSGLF